MSRRTICIAAGVLSVVGAAPAVAAVDDLELISRQAGVPIVGLAGPSTSPSVSATGRYVAFVSGDDTLSTEDDNAVANVFVRDRTTDSVTLVSRATSAAGVGANLASSAPSISGDGHLVAFVSDATNLAPGIGPAANRVYVRDVLAGTTVLVSQPEEGASTSPALSGNGSRVAFISLPGPPAAPLRRVVVRDLNTPFTAIVSRESGMSGRLASNDSYDPSINFDGSYVAFTSKDDKLGGPVDGIDNYEVYRRNVTTNVTELVSRNPGPGGRDADEGNNYDPAISADGNRIAFSSEAKDIKVLANKMVTNVYIRDMPAETTELVSRPTDPDVQADGASTLPVISADGRSVAFVSDAANLEDGDTNGASDVVVRDTLLAKTRIVSRASSASGVVGNGASTGPAVSADGSLVAFESVATNLVSADTTAATDVFARQLELATFTVRTPTVTGPRMVGMTLVCTPVVGAPTPAPAFQWLRDGVPIVGQVAASYTVVASDAGKGLVCRVSASVGATALSAISATALIPAAVVITPTPTPAPTPTPVATSATTARAATAAASAASAAVSSLAAVIAQGNSRAHGSAGLPTLQASTFSVRSLRPARTGGPLAFNGGTTLTLRSNRAGTATLTLVRLQPGRLAQGRCTTRSSVGPTCTLATRLVPAIAIPIGAGTNQVRLSGRLAGKRLPVGNYRALIVLTAGGARSATVERTLAIR